MSGLPHACTADKQQDGLMLCVACGLTWTSDETPPRCKPYECDCGRRFYSRDRVTDCTNTGHKDKPL